MKKIVTITLLVTIILSSCKKEEVTDSNAKSDITLEFDNIVGNTDLALNTATYINTAGESYTISKFDYYVSNIQLKKTDGTTYIVPQDNSYFLVKESDESSQEIELDGIPVGEYNEVSFTVGIDSLRCTADISQRTGVLDPAAGGMGMYWTWNSGYIFLKMEGTSSVSMMPGHEIFYHIGGFGGITTPTINNIKKISLNFPTSVTAKIKVGKKPEVHLLVDAKKVLDGTTNISIATSPMIMFDAASVNVANNYKNMFSVDHVHND